MRKIVIMVGMAIVVFLLFTIFSVNNSVQGSAQLSAIKDLYFPVLERVDANIVRLDKMEEQYTQLVMTGERDLLKQAGDFNDLADQAFVEMAASYPAREHEVAKLRADFKRYNELAAKTSVGFLDRSGADLIEQSTEMNRVLADVRGGLKAFRRSSYDNFVQTLADSQRAARLSLFMGIALGVMNLVFMGVLVYFIRNNMTMLSVIAEQNATLEQRVAERTAQLSQKTNDINSMLQNMKLGVCTVVPGNRIHHEYSAYLRTIFDIGEVADQDLLDSLFSRSALGADTKDQVAVALGAIIGEDAMMFEFNGHLLSREMQILGEDGRYKIIQMDWSPIVNDRDTVDKVLLIAQDVTHMRELELASAQQKEELDIIARIIMISVGKFDDFIASALRFGAENRKLIQGAPGRDPDVIAALFRNMHTIKGNARTYELTLITDAAHAAEQHYDLLRKDDQAEWNAARLLAQLDEVEAAIARYVEVNEDKLGRKGRAADLLTTRGAFVANAEIDELRSMAAEAAAGGAPGDLAGLRAAIDRLGLVPLERLVSGVADSLSSLSKELHKPAPSVTVANGDIAFNSGFAEALKSALMHIARNSLDHGIETPDDRVRAGKRAQGQIRLVHERRGDRMELSISDDGRGLDLQRLFEKGVAAGIFGAGEQPAPEAVAAIIFRAGLSTAERITQVSGRGVGMDAVRALLSEQGAEIRVALGEQRAQLGLTAFSLVISVPPAACCH